MTEGITSCFLPFGLPLVFLSLIGFLKIWVAFIFWEVSQELGSNKEIPESPFAGESGSTDLWKCSCLSTSSGFLWKPCIVWNNIFWFFFNCLYGDVQLANFLRKSLFLNFAQPLLNKLFHCVLEDLLWRTFILLTLLGRRWSLKLIMLNIQRKLSLYYESSWLYW